MKRSGIHNNARNWKPGSKHPVEPLNTPENPIQCENPPAENSELWVARASLPLRACTSFAEARQSRKAIQADEGKEAAPPS